MTVDPNRCPACKRDTVRVESHRGLECRSCGNVFRKPLAGRRGSIRLACLDCDREDQIGIDTMPEGWTEIMRDKRSWWTHVGCCPLCREQYEHDWGPSPVKQQNLFDAVTT